MNVVLWVFAVTGVVGALFAWRQHARLSNEIKQFKRDLYHAENRLKRIPDEIEEAIQPLRVQVAKVATGGAVSPEIILQGKRYLDVSAEEVHRMLDQSGGAESGRVFVVDVRTPREYAAKHIPGATVVPFDRLEAECRKVIPEAAERVVVYCAAGDRSRMACDLLSRKGYANLYNMSEGLQGWRGPVEGEGELTFIHLERRA